MKQKTIFSVPIFEKSKTALVSLLGESLSEKKQTVVFTPNPEILVKCYLDKAYRVLFRSTINIPDGVGVQMATGIPVIKGRELFLDILSLLDKQNGSCFLVGSTDDVIHKSIERIKSEYTNISVYGSSGSMLNDHGEPIDEIQVEKQQEVIRSIKRTSPSFVFVAFGAPKQEYWISKIKDQFPETSFMAVGGTLDTFSGIKSLPPTWLSNLGLEWLFRFAAEPHRFLRICTAVFIFPYLVLTSKINPKKIV